MTAHLSNRQPEAYKWLVLALSTFTFTFVVAIPQMSLPVLFAEIPVALLSDRLGSRRGVLITAAAFICMGTGFLGVAGGVLIPLAVLTAGLFRDGFMAINMTAIIEVKGIGPRFAGTAIGLSLSVMGIANVFSPPIGNWMERFGPGAPFLFWASLVGVSLVCYLFVQRTGAKS